MRRLTFRRVRPISRKCPYCGHEIGDGFCPYCTQGQPMIAAAVIAILGMLTYAALAWALEPLVGAFDDLTNERAEQD